MEIATQETKCGTARNSGGTPVYLSGRIYGIESDGFLVVAKEFDENEESESVAIPKAGRRRTLDPKSIEGYEILLRGRRDPRPMRVT
jgi:hypothetical protein